MYNIYIIVILLLIIIYILNKKKEGFSYAQDTLKTISDYYNNGGLVFGGLYINNNMNVAGNIILNNNSKVYSKIINVNKLNLNNINIKLYLPGLIFYINNNSTSTINGFSRFEYNIGKYTTVFNDFSTGNNLLENFNTNQKLVGILNPGFCVELYEDQWLNVELQNSSVTDTSGNTVLSSSNTQVKGNKFVIENYGIKPIYFYYTLTDGINIINSIEPEYNIYNSNIQHYATRGVSKLNNIKSFYVYKIESDDALKHHDPQFTYDAPPEPVDDSVI
jgi:hypothetical protein